MNALAQLKPPDANGISSWATVIVLGLILVGIIVAIAKLVDLSRRRRTERAHLRSTVTNAVMRSERLAGLTLVPRVRIPFWRGSPATVLVSGEVRTVEQRELARTTTRDAALTVRSDIEVQDRMAVASPNGHVA